MLLSNRSFYLNVAGIDAANVFSGHETSLEIRHLLVHSEGKADQPFCNIFPAVCNRVGQKIKLAKISLLADRKKLLPLMSGVKLYTYSSPENFHQSLST